MNITIGNISFFNENDTRMDVYFIRIHRDMRMRKEFLATISSAEFKTMALKSKTTKVLSFI